jgi:hypothetical protein
VLAAGVAAVPFFVDVPFVVDVVLVASGLAGAGLACLQGTQRRTQQGV